MNYKIKEIESILKSELSAKRFDHTMRVVETAIKIGEVYNMNLNNIKLAALLHDCAKNYAEQELMDLSIRNNVKLNEFQVKNKELIHSVLGRAIARNVYGIDDMDVLNAIEYHTTGRANMSNIEMIIYIADFCEPGRKVPDAEKVYNMAMVDLKESLYIAINASVKYLLNANKQIDIKSIECRNWLLNTKQEVVI
ncbi:MAG: bis(5'-nucleosyl)-tetraphosphatase (symmetrical) YqeK [Filifactoraceae bacterium]